MPSAPPDTKVRLDKWLWAARFYKTRSLSTEEIDKGRVRLNGQPVKPSREVKPGDTVELRSGPVVKTITVRALSDVRGPAPVAALLFDETAESVALRTAAAEQRRLAPEPAQSLSQGRPTKRDRRELDHLSEHPARGQWNARWSASLDE
jgi:ribosome-associated heat shock protein Hsp15